MAEEGRLSAEERFDLKLAATEAVTNALRGAALGHAVEVTLTAAPEAVEIEVVDEGVSAPLQAALHLEPEAEGGRGIPLMLALVDDVYFARTGNGTRVRMRKRLARAGEGQSAFGAGDSAFA